MNLLFAENIFGEQLVRNISWTLVHSIWQGVAAAILAMLILTTTKKAAAVLRYNLLLSTLILFCGAVVVTFLLQSGAERNAGLSDQLLTGTTIQQYQPLPLAENGKTAITSIFNFLDANSQIIVLAWFLLTVFRLAQLFIGCWNINRIKRTQVTGAGDFWNQRLTQLASYIMVTKPVKLLQSALVTTPTVVSYFKPVILIPAGLLTSLPQDEIEAILLHELSHIRRKDFLVNLLQNFIETMFFFNPFIFWISNLIREERENCCDDAAVAHLKNKTTLIKAMISCMEFNGKETSGYALAFAGRQKQLLNRVKRIISKTPRPFRAAEKLVLGLCIPLVVMLVMFVFQAFQPKIDGNSGAPSIIGIDSIPGKGNDYHDETSGTVAYVNGVAHYHYSFKRKSGSYQVEKVQGRIVSLTINGKTVASEKIQTHLPVVNSMIAEYNNIMKQPLTGLSSLADPGKLSSDSMTGLAPATGLRDGLTGLNSITNDTEAKADAPAHRNINYYDNGYKIVVQDSVVMKVYYKGTLLTNENILERKAEIDAIYKGRRENIIP